MTYFLSPSLNNLLTRSSLTMIVADVRQDELVSPVASIAGDSILDLVFRQIQSAFVAEFFAVGLTHQHHFVEEKDVTSPLTRVLIFMGFNAQNAVTLGIAKYRHV